MILLSNVLQGDRTDLDLIQLALETLANVMTYEAENNEGKINISLSLFLILKLYLLEQPNLPQDITIQFTGKYR
jgi:hypothetical protein